MALTDIQTAGTAPVVASPVMIHWYAIITRSRHERAVERLLVRLKGVETYVPLRRIWSSRLDRRVQIDVPALPGYVFLKLALWPDLRAAIKRTPGVVGFVGTESAPSRIPAEQIESMRILLRAMDDVRIETRMQVGEAVRIKSGPLAGATGVLVRVDPGHHRLVVRIAHIGMALSAHVHEADVEPMGSEQPPGRSQGGPPLYRRSVA